MRRLAPIALGTIGALAVVAPAEASSPGRLPQTSREPAFGASLTNQMRILIRAVKTDSPAIGQSVFFPEAAYLQMKTGVIPSPASDYVDRLIGFYRLDLATYHQAFFTTATSTFLRVDANAQFARWIPPGACENRVGYWHVPGVRLVFQRQGHVVSVGVASLISWRGVWYVVHLGPNPRPRDVGTLDDFERGPGTPGPPGGC
ncbi:MAG TPA: hypothetical protein VGZ68_02200 [Acidimicrobiales bacterium]|jgi:hypothetical protein|nr:hypothetical protein [Acidimicrobiales bacterium]